MKKMILGVLALSTLSTFANTQDCSLYIVDQETGREISEDAKANLESKGFTLTTNSEEATFSVMKHSKRDIYRPRTYEYYEIVKGNINGQEVVSGKTIQSKYNGFFDELGDALSMVFSSHVEFDAVDSCANMYNNPNFEYVEDNE